MFDPPWKKLKATAPSWYARAMTDWHDSVTGGLQRYRVPGGRHDLCRTYVYGRIGVALHRLTGAWFPDEAQTFITYTARAENMLPARDGAGAAINIIQGLWGDALFRAAYGDEIPQVEPRDGQTPETAITLTGADNNTWAIAGLLFGVTACELDIASIAAVKEPSDVVRVDYVDKSPLRPPQEKWFYFSIQDGEAPSLDPETYQHLRMLPLLPAAV